MAKFASISWVGAMNAASNQRVTIETNGEKSWLRSELRVLMRSERKQPGQSKARTDRIKQLKRATR